MLKQAISGLLVCLVMMVWSGQAAASASVGINTGKIQPETALIGGTTQTLATVVVNNPGSETTTYEMSVEYHEGQAQKRPARDWFTYSPDRFSLPAGGSQAVQIDVALPANAPGGTYFAYLEAHSVADQPGEAAVGAAAASKLTFSVEAVLPQPQPPSSNPPKPFVTTSRHWLQPLVFTPVGNLYELARFN